LHKNPSPEGFFVLRPYIYKMLNKINIDVRIYVDRLMEGINQMGLIESLVDEWGIKKGEDFKDLLVENITVQSSMNFEENGDPILNEEQLQEVIVRSATERTVEEMVEEGLLTKSLDENGIENSYRITLQEDGEEDDRG